MIAKPSRMSGWTRDAQPALGRICLSEARMGSRRANSPGQFYVVLSRQTLKNQAERYHRLSEITPEELQGVPGVCFGRPLLERFSVTVVSRPGFKKIAFPQEASLRTGAGVVGRRASTEVQSIMQPDTNDGFEFDEQPRLTDDLLYSHEAFDGVDSWNSQASNRKPHDGEGVLTCLTDLTPREMGVYVPPTSARPPARPRPRGCSHTISTNAVKSVKRVKSQDREGVFSPPCRQTGCQFDGSADSGVVA
jgi:hypothetical protein